MSPLHSDRTESQVNIHPAKLLFRDSDLGAEDVMAFFKLPEP